MKKESCYQLGTIIKTHALKGEIVFFIDADIPELYQKLESVFVEMKQKLVPYLIERIQINGSRAIVKLEDVSHIDQATPLVNCDLYLPLDTLPELEEDDFYLHEVVGYTLVDSQKGRLGIISNIYEGTQDLIGMAYQGAEVLIPLVDEIIKEANHELKEVYVDLPDGLIELYLDKKASIKDDEDEAEESEK